MLDNEVHRGPIGLAYGACFRDNTLGKGKFGIAQGEPGSEYVDAGIYFAVEPLQKWITVAINIDDGDRLVTVALATEDQDGFLATRKGLSLLFPVRSVRAIGRVGRGVIGIRLNKGDALVGMEILNDASAILTVTENGYGKKTNVSDYRVASRGNKGIFTIKTSKRNGLVVGIQQVDKDQEVMLITQMGKLIRMNLKSLRNIGRLTQGVRMIHMAPDEKVVSIAKIMENDDGLEEGNGENAPTNSGANGGGNSGGKGNGGGNGEKPLN